MKKLAWLMLLLAVTVGAAHAQTHTFPTLDSNNHFTGNNIIDRLEAGTGNYLAMQAVVAPFNGMVFLMTDATTSGECTVGGGSNLSWCAYYNGQWRPTSGGGGGGANPCGVLYDLQSNNGSGGFGCDTGLWLENPNTHTATLGSNAVAGTFQVLGPTGATVNVADANNQAQINAGQLAFKQTSTPPTFLGSGWTSFLSPTGAPNLGMVLPGTPGTVGQALGITAVTSNIATLGFITPASSGQVSYEDLYPLWTTGCESPATCNDLAATQIQQQQNQYLRSPLNPTDPASQLLSASPVKSIASVGTVTIGGISAIKGNTLIVVSNVQCGLGCSGIAFTVSDSLGNTFTTDTFSDGSGAQQPFNISRAPITKGGLDTITISAAPTGANYNTQGEVFQLLGTLTKDVVGTYTSASAPTPTFAAITTTTFPDTLLACTFLNDPTTAYTQGSGWYLNPVMQGGLAPFASMGCEVQNQASTGTYTPAMTATGTANGFTTSIAYHVTASGSFGTYYFGWPRYQDLSAGGDFPTLTGTGKCLSDAGTNFVGLASCTGTTIQFKNSGTNFGSPLTGAGSMNFVGCTVSGSSPNFTVTCSGATGGGVAYASDTGSVNALAVSPAGCSATLAAGQMVSTKPANTTTSTTPTMNYCSGGAVAIKFNGGNPAVGAISTAQTAIFQYDGTAWDLVNPAAIRQCWQITDLAPVSGDTIQIVYDKNSAITLTDVLGGTSAATSAVFDIKAASTSAWGTLGSSFLSGTVTAVPGGATGTFTTTSLSANTPLMVVVGTVTGSVGQLYVNVCGVKTWN
jgi:hypothetical protein